MTEFKLDFTRADHVTAKTKITFIEFLKVVDGFTFHQGSGNAMETDNVIYVNLDEGHHNTGHEGRKGSNCTSLLFL